MDMFPITWKGLPYFVSGSEKDISFIVSYTYLISVQFYIGNITNFVILEAKNPRILWFFGLKMPEFCDNNVI